LLGYELHLFKETHNLEKRKLIRLLVWFMKAGIMKHEMRENKESSRKDYEYKY